MKYLILCALILSGCGDGRIERAMSGGGAFYGGGAIQPIPEIGEDDSHARFKARMAELDAQTQQDQVDSLRSKVEQLEYTHPDLF